MFSEPSRLRSCEVRLKRICGCRWIRLVARCSELEADLTKPELAISTGAVVLCHVDWSSGTRRIHVIFCECIDLRCLFLNSGIHLSLLALVMMTLWYASFVHCNCSDLIRSLEVARRWNLDLEKNSRTDLDWVSNISTEDSISSWALVYFDSSSTGALERCGTHCKSCRLDSLHCSDFGETAGSKHNFLCWLGNRISGCAERQE